MDVLSEPLEHWYPDTTLEPWGSVEDFQGMRKCIFIMKLLNVICIS